MKSVSYLKNILVLTLIVYAGLLLPNYTFAQAPANDLCGNAVTLTSGLQACTAGTSQATSTIANATLTAGVPAPGCAGTVRFDVWYKFTATTISPKITLSGVGANF